MAKNYRLATFNLRNFIKSKEPYYGTKEYTEGERAKKEAWIANQIKCNIQPHVLGFQEVFDTEGLQSLCKTTMEKLAHFTTGGITPTKNEHGYFGRPCVALCSQLPFLEGEDSPKAIEDFPEDAILPVISGDEPIKKFSRHILRAAVEFEGIGKTIIYVAHLKSKRPKTNKIPQELTTFEEQALFVLKDNASGGILSLLQRGAESVALRYLIHNDLEKGNQVIVLGDLNDDFNSVTTKTTVGETPYSVGYRTWWAMSGREKAFVYSHLLSPAIDLVTHRYPTPGLYTHEFNGIYEVLDHIHFSNHFHPKNTSESGVGEVKRIFILNDHLHDKEEDADKQSDHGILVAQIRARKR